VVSPRFLLLLRKLSLVLSLATGVVAGWQLSPSMAYAAKDEDDDWGDEDEDDGDGGDEDNYEDDEEEAEEEGYDQPPYTAGGLYTKKTWPTSYVKRNLILIGGMAQAKVGIDIDISDRTAFDVWRTIIEAKYGITDAFEVHAGGNVVMVGEVGPTTASGSFNALLFMGMESAIAFELVDFRLTTELVYTDIDGGNIDFNFALGFPFRYRFNDKVALYALERLMTIQTDGTDPDFTLGFSVAFQPIDQLAILGGAQVNVANFNFKDNDIFIPARIGVLFAPSNTFDLGMQFTFLNLKPIDPDPNDNESPAFYDQRSILFYGQLRL